MSIICEEYVGIGNKKMNCLTSNLQMLGNSCLKRKVPQAGVEPARPFGPRDFKSLVSTDSTIRADLFVTKRCCVSFFDGRKDTSNF